ncbi:hypothetical protein BDR03DRAFT_966046 [Suillus americanus]|nr:hypothetical protein BDR03DRAFT_966046 [Suillus americanus]
MRTIREIVGGLGCGVVTKECRTGCRIHLGNMSILPFRTLLVNSDGYPSLDDSNRKAPTGRVNSFACSNLLQLKLTLTVDQDVWIYVGVRAQANSIS